MCMSFSWWKVYIKLWLRTINTRCELVTLGSKGIWDLFFILQTFIEHLWSVSPKGQKADSPIFRDDYESFLVVPFEVTYKSFTGLRKNASFRQNSKSSGFERLSFVSVSSWRAPGIVGAAPTCVFYPSHVEQEWPDFSSTSLPGLGRVLEGGIWSNRCSEVLGANSE